MIGFQNGDVLQAGKQLPVRMREQSWQQTNGFIYLPADYEASNKSYPLICFYHGAGGNGANANAVNDPGIANLISKGTIPYGKDKDGNKTEFIVYTVAGDYMGSTNSYAQIPIDINFLTEYYGLRIDKNRIYATGLSAGGNQTLYALINYSDIFAAYVPMSTRWNDLGSICKVEAPIWDFHGASDTAAQSDVNNAISGVEQYNLLHPDRKAMLTVYAGAHCCWNTMYDPTWRWMANNAKDIGDFNGLSIYDWLLQYAKYEAQPVAPAPVTIAKAIITFSDGTEKDVMGDINSVSITMNDGSVNEIK